MNKECNIFFFLCLLSLMSCNPEPTFRPANTIETNLTKAYAYFYGNYYSDEGIEQNVVALDLFSARLDLDSAMNKMVGTGTNFGFTDIFISSTDTLLPAGDYVIDSTGVSNSFLRGMNFDGFITGCYLQTVVDSVVQDIYWADDGFFTLLQDGDTTQMDFSISYKDNNIPKKYEARYRGIINYYIEQTFDAPKRLRFVSKQ